MAKGVDDFIDRYSESETHRRSGSLRALSIRIDPESMIILETLAHHLGKKKTPLMGELAESVIHDVFDRLQDDMEPELLREMSEEMEELKHV